MTEDTTKPLKFYTTNELADLLKMNVQVIARKLQSGELVGYKLGKDWRVTETDLMTWLDRCSNRHRQNPGELVVSRFMKNGKIDALPVQRKKRVYILEHILRQFELNRIYTEKEVNETITRFHDDYCRVRREFIMEKMMNRKNGKYRRIASYRFTG